MIAGAIHISPEASALVRVSAQGPFAAGALVWRDAQGRLVCTIVAKATYELVPGESAPIEPPHPIQAADSHWDDDPSRSVHIPSDLVPFKHAAEVVVVGSAFAPAPVASLVARVLVGSVDKSVEAFPPRHFRQDGTISPVTPLPRFSLRYERAAGGGPGTDNPTGIDVARADAAGRRPLPQLVPPFFTARTPGEHVPTVGFGPIAPTWPLRAAALGPNDRAWLRQPARVALPPSFPARFFQAAPSDQWLDRLLVANERIVLEGLHPDVGRLVMSLSGFEPRALIAGVAQPMRLTADLLFIDTEQSICTLTYRAQIPLDEGRGPLKVVVAGAPAGREISAEEAQHILETEGEDIETTHVEGISLGLPPPAGMTGKLAAWRERPVLPFAYEPSSRAPQPSSPDGALPFRAPGPPDVAATPKARDSFAPLAPRGPVSFAPANPEPPKPQARPVTVAPAHPEPPKPLLVAPPALVAPASASPVVPAAAPSPGPAISIQAPSATIAPIRLGVDLQVASASAKPVDPPARRASLPPASFDAAFGGAKAAGGAAVKAAPLEAVPVKREAGDAGRTQPGDADGRRQAVVSLLCFDAKIVPRVRASKRFAPALASKARAKRVQGLDAPRRDEPGDDRADVLRVLSCGRPADAAEIHRALAESLDDLDDLDPPLVLVAGELRPTFDEIEVLRATVAVAQQVAGGDKKVLATIAVGQEALAAPVAPRPETTLGLVQRIEQASASLSLPARYVAAEVERVLVEGRKYKRRPLLGAPRVRADLTLVRGNEVMPVYLPDAAAASLPLLLSFPVVALCEVAPREDLSEVQDEALFAQALGRVLRSR